MGTARTSPRSSFRTSRRSAPITRTVRPPASRRDWSSSRPTARRRSNARNTRRTRRSGFPAPRNRKARRGCGSPPTSWARRPRSPNGATRTRRSARSTRWLSPCRSPSNSKLTCRSSPTSRNASVRRWAGSPDLLVGARGQDLVDHEDRGVLRGDVAAQDLRAVDGHVVARALDLERAAGGVQRLEVTGRLEALGVVALADAVVLQDRRQLGRLARQLGELGVAQR